VRCEFAVEFPFFPYLDEIAGDDLGLPQWSIIWVHFVKKAYPLFDVDNMESS
jgi:hypothetical protein